MKKLYFILSYTWGIIMVLVGYLVAGVLEVLRQFNGKFKLPIITMTRFGPCLHIKVGNKWGGVSLGQVIITDNTPSEHTLNHEFGHTIQNAIFGPLFIFLVAIPSACWYQIHMYKDKFDKKIPDYDTAWFEGMATKLGDKYIDKFK